MSTTIWFIRFITLHLFNERKNTPGGGKIIISLVQLDLNDCLLFIAERSIEVLAVVSIIMINTIRHVNCSTGVDSSFRFRHLFHLPQIVEYITLGTDYIVMIQLRSVYQMTTDIQRGKATPALRAATPISAATEL